MKKEQNLENNIGQALTIPVVMGCKFVKSKYSSAWSGVVIVKKNRTMFNN